MTTKILLIGANGQIGSELAVELAKRHGNANVITSDVAPQGRVPQLTHEMLDVTDAAALAAVVKRHGITRVPSRPSDRRRPSARRRRRR